MLYLTWQLGTMVLRFNLTMFFQFIRQTFRLILFGSVELAVDSDVTLTQKITADKLFVYIY